MPYHVTIPALSIGKRTFDIGTTSTMSIIQCKSDTFGSCRQLLLAGGRYHRVSEFAPKKSQRISSYMSWWLSTLAWQSFVAVDSFIVGEVILGMTAIQSFVSQRWQATLVIIGTLLALVAFESFAEKWLAGSKRWFFAFDLLALFPVVVTLLGMTRGKTTAKALFADLRTMGLVRVRCA